MEGTLWSARCNHPRLVVAGTGKTLEYEHNNDKNNNQLKYNIRDVRVPCSSSHSLLLMALNRQPRQKIPAESTVVLAFLLDI